MSMLSQPALVLNKSWVAITTTTVKRALTMVYGGEARVVEPESYSTFDFNSWSELGVARDHEFIQTVSFRIRIPEVILLTYYNGMPQMEVVFTRRNLYRRDKYTCQYCGCKPGSEELTIDHILPRSRGGKSTWENCVLACVKCNHKKSNMTPAESHMHLLNDPIEPSWNPTIKIGLGRRKVAWAKFLSERYWNIALEE